MKPENVDRQELRVNRRRGPLPKDRLSELEAAHVALGTARQNPTIDAVCAKLGWLKPQWVNVLRGRRGVDQTERRRLHEVSVLPGSPSWNALATDPYGWFSRLTYGPLLSPSTLSLSPPHAHVVIDKIVFHATLVDLGALVAKHPELDALPGARGPFFTLRTSRGSYRAFIEHSGADWYSRKDKQLPYERTLNVKAHVDGTRVTLAKLSVTPRFPRMGRNQARFEITGMGCVLGLAPQLSHMLFTPFIDPRTTQLAEIHLAIDIDAPSRFLVAFQERPSGKGIPRKRAVHWNDFDNVGHSFGSRKSPFFGALYDKRRQVADLRFAEDRPRKRAAKAGPRKSPRSPIAILPAHAADFEDIARIELRFRPKELGLIGWPVTVLPMLLDWIAPLAIADLRYLGQATPEAALACEAQRYGFAPQRPTLKDVRAKRAAEKPGMSSEFKHGERCLARLLDLGVDPEWAEHVAQTLHTATLAELLRVSRLTPIDLRAIVEAHVPRLQAELDACLSPPSGFMHMPAPSHHARSPENAAQGPRRPTGSKGHESLINALCGPS